MLHGCYDHDSDFNLLRPEHLRDAVHRRDRRVKSARDLDRGGGLRGGDRTRKARFGERDAGIQPLSAA